VFELDGCEEEWKLEMHGNQKTSYGLERQVDG